jgi:hypothetical protein
LDPAHGRGQAAKPARRFRRTRIRPKNALSCRLARGADDIGEHQDLLGAGGVSLDGAPLCPKGKRQKVRRPMDPDAIDHVVRKFVTALGLDLHHHGALKWRQLEDDVQKAAGHRDLGTTKLYDRRGYNLEKAASFCATY